jgi:hypothetical protein
MRTSVQTVHELIQGIASIDGPGVFDPQYGRFVAKVSALGGEDAG